MDFNEEYYSETIKRNNYNPLDFAPMDFEFRGIPRDVMAVKWLCHTGINSINPNEKLIVTSGIGLSGVPHMGTLSQIMRAIFLQKNGVEVQLVLGDLDSYNARNKDLDYVKKLSEVYRRFILELGFDENKGILRNQSDYPLINQNAYYYSKYLTDSDFNNTEEDLSKLYIDRHIYNGITFPVKQAILLMISDFISLSNKTSNVIVMLGLEEHRYVLLTKELVKRLGIDFNVFAMYSRIIRGLNGFPKMSKSIRESSISVDMTESQILSIITNEKDNYNTPDDSVLFQMISAISDYSPNDLLLIRKECANKTQEWNDIKINYAKRLYEICSKWK